MPRRLITSAIFLNEKFGQLDDAGRILFIGCFSNADDDGRLKASPSYLKALIFPYDNEKTVDMVKEKRNDCAELGLLHIYNRNGTEYLYCIGWEEHQVIRKDRYRPSTLPPPNAMMPTTKQPSDNRESTNGLPPDDQVTPPIESNLIQSNIIDNRELKKFPPQHIPLRKQIFSELQKRREYASRNPGGEAKAISQMLLEGFSVEDILRAYDIIKEQPFFQDKNLSMMQVRKDIHEVLKGGTHRQSPRANPKEYTTPEEYRKARQ